MKNILLILFLVKISSVCHAQLEKIQSLAELAARKQYEYYSVTYQLQDFGPARGYHYVNEMNKAHGQLLSEILKYDFKTLSSPETDIAGKCLVQVLAYMYVRDISSIEGHEAQDILSILEDIIPDYPVYRYLYYQFNKDKFQDSDKKINFLLETYKLADRKFPECALEIVFAYLSAGDDSRVKLYKEEYIQTLEFYKPVLNYFDSGYPIVPKKVLIYPGRLLERQIYNSNPLRFTINSRRKE